MSKSILKQDSERRRLDRLAGREERLPGRYLECQEACRWELGETVTVVEDHMARHGYDYDHGKSLPSNVRALLALVRL